MAILVFNNEEYDVDVELTYNFGLVDLATYNAYTKSFEIDFEKMSILNTYASFAIKNNIRKISAKLIVDNFELFGFIIINSFDFDFLTLKKATLTFYQTTTLFDNLKLKKVSDLNLNLFNHYYNVDNALLTMQNQLYKNYTGTTLSTLVTYDFPSLTKQNNIEPTNFIRYVVPSLIERAPLSGRIYNTWYNSTCFVPTFNNFKILKKIFSEQNYILNDIDRDWYILSSKFIKSNLQYFDETNNDVNYYTEQIKDMYNLKHGDEFINKNSFIAGLSATIAGTSTSTASTITFNTGDLQFTKLTGSKTLSVGVDTTAESYLSFNYLPNSGGYYIPASSFSFTVYDNISPFTHSYTHGSATTPRANIADVYNDIVTLINSQTNLLTYNTITYSNVNTSSFDIKLIANSAGSDYNWIDKQKTISGAFNFELGQNKPSTSPSTLNVSYRNSLGSEYLGTSSVPTLRVDELTGKVKSGYDVINQKLSVYLEVDLPNWVNVLTSSYIKNTLRFKVIRKKAGVTTTMWDDQIFVLTNWGAVAYANPNLFYSLSSPITTWDLLPQFDKSYKIWGTLTFDLTTNYSSGAGESAQPLSHGYIGDTEEEIYFQVYSNQDSLGTIPSNRVANRFRITDDSYIYNTPTTEVRDGSIIRVNQHMPITTQSNYISQYLQTNNLIMNIDEKNRKVNIIERNEYYKNYLDITDLFDSNLIRIEYTPTNSIKNIIFKTKENANKISINKDIQLDNYSSTTKTIDFTYDIPNKTNIFSADISGDSKNDFSLIKLERNYLDNIYYYDLRNTNINNNISWTVLKSDIYTIANQNNIFDDIYLYNNFTKYLQSMVYTEIQLDITNETQIIKELIFGKVGVVYIKQLTSYFIIDELIYNDSSKIMKLKLLKRN